MSEYESFESNGSANVGNNHRSGYLYALVSIVFLFCIASLAVPFFSEMVIDKFKPDPSDKAISETNSTATAGLTNESYLEAFAWAARVRLEELNIHRSLKVSVTQQGEIKISGRLPHSLMPRYRLFKSWYTEKKTFPPILDNVNALEAGLQLPSIASVWLAEPHTVFFDNGTSGSVGDVIDNGWTLTGISQTEVILSRQDLEIALAIK